MPRIAGEPLRHLYVHFPFCAHKCPYCDFNSHARREDETDAYIDALLAEAQAHAGQVRPETVFVGGGTPTHCTPEQLKRYLAGVLKPFDMSALREMTVEANPGTLDAEKVEALASVGVDRVSMGAQSFHDHHLKTLGRIHDASDTARSVERLREGGIGRVSLDLILATPGQTLAEQARDVEATLALTPDHVSAYVLTYEEGTVFTKRMRQGLLPPPHPDREIEHLHLVRKGLEAAGYARYEISNYARAGEQSLHNLAYWRNVEWLGLGAGAHSHVDGRRWKNIDDPSSYSAQALAGERPEAWSESVSPALRLFESLMMGLRLVEGVDLEELKERHGIDVRVVHADAIARHAAGGFLRLDRARLRLTETGLDVANTVITDFYPDESPAAGS